MALAYLRGSGPDPFPGTSPHTGEVLDALSAYVRDVADRLGLKSWRIAVSRGVPNSKDAIAETYFRDAATEAVVAFSPVFFDWAEPERRATILHEILHCAFHPITRWARDAVDTELGQRWETLFEHSLGELEEQSVDGLAHALAPLFPESPGSQA